MLPSADQLTHEAHPELFHYTSKAGLEGIITSQSLWATRYDCLNDSQEVFQIKPLLVRSLAERCKRYLMEAKTGNLSTKLLIAKHGGTVAASREFAIRAINSLYTVSFEGKPNSVAYMTPFITSFCSHEGDSEYERQNGLLSQWRGYGRASGFAIVFDTKALWQAFEQDAAAYSYTTAQFPDAYYTDEEALADPNFQPLIENLFRYFQYAEDRMADVLVEALVPFLNLVTRKKHRGFREEREVRLVVFPRTEELFQQFASQVRAEIEFTGKRKVVHTAPSGKSYVVLFEDTTRLPINRIIVGPGVDQGEKVQFAKKLVRSKIQIVRSETPFIDR